jgi:hypothetical protein
MLVLPEVIEWDNIDEKLLAINMYVHSLFLSTN